MKNVFYGKTMEKVRNRFEKDIIIKENDEIFFQKTIKINFNGIHKSYTYEVSCTIK